MKTPLTTSCLPFLLSALFLVDSLPAFAASETVVLEPEPGDFWETHHSEMTATVEVTSEGLEIICEIIPPPGVNYLSTSHPWQWEVPVDGKIEVELHSAINRGCYLSMRLDTSDGRRFSALFSGDPKTGFLMSNSGSTAELFLSDFKTEAGETLKPGDQVDQVVLIVAPDASNTITISKIALIPEE